MLDLSIIEVTFTTMSPRIISSAARLKACSFNLIIPKVHSSSILIFSAIFADIIVVVHLAYHKGAGASEAGGQTKEGALSKRYFQTSEIAQNRTKSPVPIVIDVFGVTAPYGNPYGSKIAIVWLFFVIF